MELRVLQYFLAVAREQSISAAAQSLHLSQPTLSRQIKELEEELGKALEAVRRGEDPGETSRAFCESVRKKGLRICWLPDRKPL